LDAGSARLLTADFNEDFASQFGSQRYDLVACSEVIEYLENPRNLLRRAKRLLASGGMLLVITPNIESTAGRLRFLRTGKLRHLGPASVFNEPTHTTPIHTLMFERVLGEFGLRVPEHDYEEFLGSSSRWPFRVVASLLDPLLRGPRGGDTHI
jgi:2-polyprenyl-3-methyl-5-hydroxy-6-metoxy-1,4-benzoquinol methylase